MNENISCCFTILVTKIPATLIIYSIKVFVFNFLGTNFLAPTRGYCRDNQLVLGSFIWECYVVFMIKAVFQPPRCSIGLFWCSQQLWVAKSMAVTQSEWEWLLQMT